MAYERPLCEFRDAMQSEGVATRITRQGDSILRSNDASACIAMRNGSDPDDIPFIDVEYVDDAAFILIASTPQTLGWRRLRLNLNKNH